MTLYRPYIGFGYAAWAYLLISPLRIVCRCTRALARSVTGGRRAHGCCPRGHRSMRRRRTAAPPFREPRRKTAPGPYCGAIRVSVGVSALQPVFSRRCRLRGPRRMSCGRSRASARRTRCGRSAAIAISFAVSSVSRLPLGAAIHAAVGGHGEVRRPRAWRQVVCRRDVRTVDGCPHASGPSDFAHV